MLPPNYPSISHQAHCHDAVNSHKTFCKEAPKPMKAFTSAILSIATLSTALAIEPGRYLITTQYVVTGGSEPGRGYILTIGTQGGVVLEAAAYGRPDIPRTESAKLIEGTDGSFILTAQFTVFDPLPHPAPRSIRQGSSQSAPAPEIQPEKDDFVIHYLNLSFPKYPLNHTAGGSEISLRGAPSLLRAQIAALSKAVSGHPKCTT